jgi:hypothetical protein
MYTRPWMLGLSSRKYATFSLQGQRALVIASVGLVGATLVIGCGEGSIEATRGLPSSLSTGVAGATGDGGSGASSGAGGARGTGSGGISSTTGAPTTTTSGGVAGAGQGAGGSAVATSGSGGQVGTSAGSGGASVGAAGDPGGSGGSGTSTGAWRPFNDASPWNTPVPASPALDPNSDALVADLAASTPNPSFWINIQQYSIPVFWAAASTASQKVTVTILAGQGFGNGSSGSALVPIPAGAAPAAGTDRHLCIVDKQASTEWGMWDASNSAGWTCSVAATSDLSGTGVRPPKTGNPTWWTSPGARACGFPLIAGLITVEEMRKGKIEHALVIAYPHMRSHWYKPPASTAQPTTDLALPTRGVPCGGRIQLDPAIDVSALALSASGKIIARALQEYGAYVGDFSGAISLYADASPDAQAAWNGGLLQNGELGGLDLKKLRVLSIGTMLEDTN